MATLKRDLVDDVLEQCLLSCLDSDGHSLYLRNPITNESEIIAFETTGLSADAKRRKIRRVLCGIVGTVLQEYLR